MERRLPAGTRRRPSPGRSLAATRAFFAPRAAGWEAGVPNDGLVFSLAVAFLRPQPGGVVVDLGCGTGRAFEALRVAVGPAGTVIGVDATPEMLSVAASLGRTSLAPLVQGDARSLPLPDGVADGVLAAGLLLPWLADPEMVLAEAARVTRHAGRLAAFQPRRPPAAQAPVHRDRRDPLDPQRMLATLVRAGWSPVRAVERGGRHLVLATRP